MPLRPAPDCQLLRPGIVASLLLAVMVCDEQYHLPIADKEHQWVGTGSCCHHKLLLLQQSMLYCSVRLLYRRIQAAVLASTLLAVTRDSCAAGKWRPHWAAYVLHAAAGATLR
jgi:hypothetical protein